MYNHLLDTFIAVTDCGSFNRAAGKLHITSTAVMKQMNTLEANLGLKLIERTPSGVYLTEAGARIYQDAKFLIEYSRRALESARAAARTGDNTFRVGTSLLNPARPFMDLWYQVNQEFPDYKLHLVSFEDDHEGKFRIGVGRGTDAGPAFADAAVSLPQPLRNVSGKGRGFVAVGLDDKKDVLAGAFVHWRILCQARHDCKSVPLFFATCQTAGFAVQDGHDFPARRAGRRDAP